MYINKLFTYLTPLFYNKIPKLSGENKELFKYICNEYGDNKKNINNAIRYVIEKNDELIDDLFTEILEKNIKISKDRKIELIFNFIEKTIKSIANNIIYSDKILEIILYKRNRENYKLFSNIVYKIITNEKKIIIESILSDTEENIIKNQSYYENILEKKNIEIENYKEIIKDLMKELINYKNNNMTEDNIGMIDDISKEDLINDFIIKKI